MSDRQATCEERIDAHLEGREEWIAQLLYRTDNPWTEADLAAMDYEEVREIARLVGELPWSKGSDGRYRSIRSRADLTRHIVEECDPDRAYEGLSEAPLSVEVRRTLVVQLSWGGPSDQFEADLDDDGELGDVLYRFLDWFDGATRPVRNEDVDRFISHFAEILEEVR